MRLVRLKDNDQKGQALVEMAFALVLMIFMFLLMAQIGYMIHVYISVVHLSREGARYGVVNPASDQAILNYIQQITPPQVKHEKMSIAISPLQGAPQRTSNNPLTISITYDFAGNLFIPTTFYGITLPTILGPVATTMVIE